MATLQKAFASAPTGKRAATRSYRSVLPAAPTALVAQPRLARTTKAIAAGGGGTARPTTGQIWP